MIWSRFVIAYLGTDNASLLWVNLVDIILLKSCCWSILMTFYHASQFPSSMQYDENTKEVVKKSG